MSTTKLKAFVVQHVENLAALVFKRERAAVTLEEVKNKTEGELPKRC